MKLYEIFRRTYSPHPLPLSRSLGPNYRDEHGYSRPSESNQWTLLTDSEFEMYSSRDTWLHYMEVITADTDEDISVYYENNDGVRSKMTLSSRIPHTAVTEKLVFKCGALLSKVIITNSEHRPVNLVGVKLIGVRVKALSNTIIEGYRAWEEYKNDQESFNNSLNEEVANLNLKLEDIQRNIDTYEKENESLKKQNESLKRAIALNNEQQKTVEEYLVTAEGKLNKTISEEKKLETLIVKKQNDLEKIYKESNQAKNDVDKVLEDLSIVKTELKEFESKRRLYSEDFSTFKDGLRNDNILYSSLLFLIIVIGGLLILQVKEGAELLLSSFDDGQVKNIWALLISRLPTISVNILSISFFIAVSHFLMNLIVNNNKQINKVKQIAYLVKQTADVQAQGLALSDEDIYAKRVESKLYLISESFIKKEDISHREISNVHSSVPLKEDKNVKVVKES